MLQCRQLSSEYKSLVKVLTVKTDCLIFFNGQSGYPPCMVYLVLEANCIASSGIRKRGGNNLSLWLFYTMQPARVTTLWLKQPICFYSV